LNQLILSHNQIRDDIAIVFADMLKVNATITKIDFSATWIGKEGAFAIANMLNSKF
jgi:Ran GTPase-activating protein (RanGAP) involved in mRNA processing and transport